MATDVDAVKLVYPWPPNKPEDAIDAAIADAGLIITEELSGTGLSPARMNLIHKYLAAHLLQLADGGELRRQRVMEVDESYVASPNDQGSLGSTRYGQLALGLDTSGTLAAAGASGGLKARLEVVGENPIGSACTWT